MKLCIDLCLECTRLALFLSSSLIHSIIYLFLNRILSHIGISLFFILVFSPCTRCMPCPKRSSKSSCLMYPLSAKFLSKHLPYSFVSVIHVSACETKSYYFS